MRKKTQPEAPDSKPLKRPYLKPCWLFTIGTL